MLDNGQIMNIPQKKTAGFFLYFQKSVLPLWLPHSCFFFSSEKFHDPPPLVHSNQCISHVNWFYCVNSLHSFAYSVSQNFSINFAKIHLSLYLYLSVSLTLVFTRRKYLSFLLSFSFCLNRHPNVSSDALLLWVCKIASTEKTWKNNVIGREREREIKPHTSKLSSSSSPPKRWRIILNFINNQKLEN